MKIRDIYLRKGSFIVSAVIVLLCVAVTTISQLVPSMYKVFAFTYPVKYPWQLITYQFQHGMTTELLPADFSYSAAQLTIGHLIFNLLLAIPFGILVEKVIGSRKFLVMAVAAWVVDIILIFTAAYFTTPAGEETVSCGASGLVFSFMPIGMYILFVLGKKYGFKNLLKQVSFYLLLPIAIATLVFALSPNAGGVAGIWSMILHLLGLSCGVLFTVIYRKKIWENTSKTDME